MERIKEKVAVLIDTKTDTVRIYTLCRECRSRAEVLGEGDVLQERMYVIV